MAPRQWPEGSRKDGPHLEDHNATAGGDGTSLRRPMGRYIDFNGGTRNQPPGENKFFDGDGPNTTGRGNDEIENEAAEKGLPKDDDEVAPPVDFLDLLRKAEEQSQVYMNQVNRRTWSQAYHAFLNEHFAGSKYHKSDYRNRSKFFRAKTRSAVRKDMAAVAASLFSNIDAINCLPGNESDPRQKGAAAVMEELVNYRTDRSSGKASIPWFLVSIGARQNALLTGICLSKQCWKQEFKKKGTERISMPNDQGVYEEVERDVWVLDTDRPDVLLVPPENFVIDPAADWTNPAQSAAYVIIKWPMQLEEIKQKMNSPLNPWKEVDESVLRQSVESSTFDMAAIRRARELGLDRMDATQTGTKFQIIWVYETYMRYGGEDWTFYSIGDKVYLTDPAPVEEVYPEQFGERPLALGYGALESHRIFPMSPVYSWQQHQLELNDMVNLGLDALKQNVMPVTKVVRGKQVDLDQVKRRAHGSSIMVQNKDDVTWERPPDLPNSLPMMTREIELEMDDLAGQFNGQTAENNNALSRTLGGLKLVSGTANAIQEFDIRIWIETWASPVLAQVVRLEQYYESDPVILGLCGERAQLSIKHGISEIDDDLLEQQIVVRVSVGLGAGDPQQRLMKFTSATQIVAPLLAQCPEFQRGEVEMDWEAVTDEVFGSAGYRDGGKRFFKKGQPQQNPMQGLNAQKIMADIEKAKKQGNAAMVTALAQAAKVALGNKQREDAAVDGMLGRYLEATRMGFEHGHKHNDQHLSALDHGHRHGLALANHRQQIAQDALNGAEQDQGDIGQDTGNQDTGNQDMGEAQDEPMPQAQPMPEPRRERMIKFIRDPRTGKISGAKIVDEAAEMPPPDQRPGQEVPLPPMGP